VGPFAVLGCAYLFAGLSTFTMIVFVIWNVIGLAAYLLYFRTTSDLARA
jgi:APA family basic amino acid/polyamine antiporter